MKHKSKDFIVITPSITFWRVVSPRLVRCHLGGSDKIVKLNQGVCTGKEIAYFVKIYPSEASSSWRWPWWDRQGCFFVDPSWVEPSVDSRNCYPPWTYDSTSYRNHANNLRVYIVFAPSKVLPLPSCAMFYISLLYS